MILRIRAHVMLKCFPREDGDVAWVVPVRVSKAPRSVEGELPYARQTEG